MPFRQGALDPIKETETLFEESLEQALRDLDAVYDIDLVIGIPFYNETGTLPGILKTVEEALPSIGNYQKPLILCVGDPAGAETLSVIQQMEFSFAHYEFLMQPGSNGRGASIRTMLEIADHFSADMVIFAADLSHTESQGLKPQWLTQLVAPLGQKYDVVISTYRQHYFEDVVTSFLISPLLEQFYKYRITGAISGLYALSHNVVEDLCLEFKFWPGITSGYGIDPWLVTRVMRWNKEICEVPLGTKLERVSLEKVNYVFKDMARALFACIGKDEDYWLKGATVCRIPDVFNSKYLDEPAEVMFDPREMILHYKRNFGQYQTVFQTTLSEKIYRVLQKAVSSPGKDFHLDSKTWAELVLAFLFEFCFSADAKQDDILNALTSAFNGRIASYVLHIQWLREHLTSLKTVYREHFVELEACAFKEDQRQHFMASHQTFKTRWSEKLLEVTPPLTPSRYLEYVPGIPVVLPNTISGRGGRTVHTEAVFNGLQKRYQEAFENVIHQSLGVPADAKPGDIVDRVMDFMEKLEQTMELLFPGDLYSEDGVGQVLERLFERFPHSAMYSVRDQVFREVLTRFPPVNVMIPTGCCSTRDLLNKMDVRDATSLSNLIESRKWADRALLWGLENLRPEGLEEVDIKYLVLDTRIGQIAHLGNISNLNKITTRIVTAPLNKGMGGAFPRLRFCLFIARHISIAENYSRLWKTFARERKNLGTKIANSLIGRYEATAFSAHNIFENLHHRKMIGYFKDLAINLASQGQHESARILNIMCEGYGLSQTLSDGTFLPLSAWSWASYYYKGGQGVPSPLSSHVEEKWFNHDLLEEIYSELGYDIDEIESGITQLIGEGRASENVLDSLLGIRPKDVAVVAQEAIAHPPARPLIRYSGNPILNPIKEHYWESKYVLNAASLRLNDRVYLLYRAYGDDQVSRIGLAITDGFKVLERLPEPVFSPGTEKESKGCEDPRVVIINEEIYMMYTAYDGAIAQISAASIKVQDFLERRFDRWERKGLAFKDVWNKDAVLFPEKIQNKYVIYHRIEPSIWVSYLDKLEFPVPRERHAIIIGPRSGQMWDALKIGSGTQPLKTRYGWLMIYHGVDRKLVYRLGVILVDLNNPELLIYRSPNPILQPEEQYEIGSGSGAWVPNVVFTCGAVAASDKKILEDEDEILVYYGAADTCIAVATATLADLIPPEYRK